MIFKHQHCYFFWKPPEIASTRGKQQSFLDIAFEGSDTTTNKNLDLIAEMEGSRTQLDQHTQQIFLDVMQGSEIEQVEDVQIVIDELKKMFGHDQEYGLLNRLDTVTSGLLYFAKTPEIYTSRKHRQSEYKIKKYYLAKTELPVSSQDISLPLGHHTNSRKMIVVDEDLLNSKRKQKIKGGHLLPACTSIVKNVNNYNLIHIHKGWRHQIRAHLAYIGHPISGEKLYHDSDEKHLQLYSIGCKVGV